MARGRNALYWKIHQSLGQYRITDAGKGESIISMKGGTPTFIDPADELLDARLAAEREEERELRRLEKEEKKRKLEEARKKKGERG